MITAIALVAVLARPAPSCQVPPSKTAVRSLTADVRFLASDALGGRMTGSEGSNRAAGYLQRRFGSVGAKAGPTGWLQPFAIAPDLPAFHGLPAGSTPTAGKNVIAVIPGTDVALRDEAVVVGAHYDHLGTGFSQAMSLGHAGAIHNGADDNASGTTALIEIARQLAKCPAKRSVVVVAFAGEELGLLGSMAYVKAPAVPIARTVAMVNLDMVGRLRNDRLLAFGSETAVEFPALLDSLNQRAKFDLKYSGDGFGRSDQQSFYVAGKPVLHLFTDLHEDYHRESDDWEKINVVGLSRVATFAADLVRTLANRVEPLTFVSKPPPAPVATGTASSGYGAYFGSIPDMSVGGPGVRLSGVRPDSPAAKVGLKEGDVLLGLGDFDITDLQSMTDALRAHRPGDTVMVRFRRGTAIDSASAVLGRRGGS